MGLGDYLWPFQKPFTKVPCAREAALGALIGGPCLGAASIIFTKRYSYAFKTTTYSSFLIFWITFLPCRFNEARSKRLSEQFMQAVEEGKVN